MNRRGFFSTLLGGFVGARLAPLAKHLPATWRAVIASTPTTGTYAGINRSTFSFWRQEQSGGYVSQVSMLDGRQPRQSGVITKLSDTD